MSDAASAVIGLMNPGQSYEALSNLASQMEAESKAKNTEILSQAKEAISGQKEATDAMLLQQAKVQQGEDAQAQAVAQGNASILGQLSADPLDPTSNMARNNAAIMDINKRILDQYDAINAVQQDDSVMGILNKYLNLPGLQRGAEQLTAQKDQLVSVNDQLLREVNLEDRQVVDTIKTRDVGTEMAKNALVSFAAVAKANEGKLKSIGELAQLQHQASSEEINLAATKAQAAQQAVMAPLQEAIARNQLYKMEEERAGDNIIANALGIKPVRFREIKGMLQSNPQVWNAVSFYALSGGKFNMPGDYALIDQLQNKQALVNADGTPMESAVITSQASRRKDQIDSVMAGYSTYIKTKYAADLTMQEKVLKEPRAFPQDWQEYKQQLVKAGTPIESDMVKWNPKMIFNEMPELAARVPAIAEVAQNLSDPHIDMPPATLIKQVVRQNMDATPADLARQVTEYFQTVTKADQQNTIWARLSMPAPNAVTIKMDNPTWLNRWAGIRFGTADDFNSIKINGLKQADIEGAIAAEQMQVRMEHKVNAPPNSVVNPNLMPK